MLLSSDKPLIFSSDSHTELYTGFAGRCIYNFVVLNNFDIQFTPLKLSSIAPSIENHDAKLRLVEVINGAEVPLGTFNFETDLYQPSASGLVELKSLRSRTSRVVS